MNAIYSIGAQTFGLLKVNDLTFIPLKVRFLLFKDIIFLLSLLCEKGRGRVSSVRYCLRVLIR